MISRSKKSMRVSFSWILLFTTMMVSTLGAHGLAVATGTPKTGDAVELEHGASSAILHEEKSAAWNVPFWAVPSGSDSLYIHTDQTVDVGASVNTDIAIGQARVRFAMTYTKGSYETLATQIPFTGGTTEGTIALTSELDDGGELSTREIEFRHFYVPNYGAPPLVSTDNLLEMIVGDYSLPADVYVVVMDINAIPEPVPLGHKVIGQPYSVRSSGAVTESLYPMLVTLAYTDITLGDADPHTMSIFEWDSGTRQWIALGGVLDDWFGHSITAPTSKFTVYSLMSTPRWVDDFADYSGLSERENLTVLPWDGVLVLDGQHATGFAVSREITPLDGIEQWDRLQFDATIPDYTSLKIDLLDANDTPLLTDISGETDLSMIDPEQYPSLKLQASFSTQDTEKSASLNWWKITWQPPPPPTYELFTPLVMGTD